MWLFYAFLSAIAAALVAIFGKIGLQRIDSTLATSLRAIVMATLTFFIALGFGKYKDFSFDSITSKEWLWIVLAGVAGAASWLFYFFALKEGVATKVVAIDRLSIVFVFILALLFLGESFSWRSAIGALLIVCGTILMSIKWVDLQILVKDLVSWLK